MLPTKYLIVIILISVLFFVYYFYDQIAQLKELVVPNYQKTMALEKKIADLETRSANLNANLNTLIYLDPKKKQNLHESVMSISYRSDLPKFGNLSVIYDDLSTTEADDLLQKIKSRTDHNPPTDHPSNKSLKKSPNTAPKKELSNKINNIPDTRVLHTKKINSTIKSNPNHMTNTVKDSSPKKFFSDNHFTNNKSFTAISDEMPLHFNSDRIKKKLPLNNSNNKMTSTSEHLANMLNLSSAQLDHKSKLERIYHSLSEEKITEDNISSVDINTEAVNNIDNGLIQ